MKKYLIILVLLITNVVYAQQGTAKQHQSDNENKKSIDKPQSGGGFKMPAIGRLYGKIIDAKTKESVPFASVAVFKADSAIAGCFTKNNGEFNIDALPFGKF